MRHGSSCLGRNVPHFVDEVYIDSNYRYMRHTCSDVLLSSGAAMRAAWNTEGRSPARKGYLRFCLRQREEVESQW